MAAHTRLHPRPVDWIVLGLAAALVALGLYLQERMDRLAGWPRTAAEIVSSQLAHGQASRSKTWHPDIRYRYQVAGRVYTGRRVGLMEIGTGVRSWVEPVVRRHPPGSRAWVHYDPADPSRSVLEPRWGRPFVHGITWAGVALWMSWIGLVVWKRRQGATQGHSRPARAGGADHQPAPNSPTAPERAVHGSGPVVVDQGREDRRRLLLLVLLIGVLGGGYWAWEYGGRDLLQAPTRPAERDHPTRASEAANDRALPARPAAPAREAGGTPSSPASGTGDIGLAATPSRPRAPGAEAQRGDAAESHPKAVGSAPGRPGWTVLHEPGDRPVQTAFITHLQVRPWKLGAAERRVPLVHHLQACALPQGDYPPQEGPPWYGRITLNGRMHCVAVTGWEPGGRPLLWFDLGGGDAPRYRPHVNRGSGRLGTEVAIPMPDPGVREAHTTNAKYAIWIWIREVSGRPVAYYYPVVELEGAVTLAGERRKVVVAERAGAMDGDFGDDGLYVDLNGDGRLTDDEYVPPKAVLQTQDGALWRLVVAPGADAGR